MGRPGWEIRQQGEVLGEAAVKMLPINAPGSSGFTVEYERTAYANLSKQSGLKSFRSEARTSKKPGLIFVTVGTDQHDFSRLVRKMDEIARRKSVIMQIGWTKFEPRNAEWFRFESNKRIDELYRSADIIVTHGGAGSIIRSLKEGKVPVVVPRRADFGEHVNNHQLDLGRSLEKKREVALVEDVNEIKGKLKKRLIKKKPGAGLPERLAGYLKGIG